MNENADRRIVRQVVPIDHDLFRSAGLDTDQLTTRQELGFEDAPIVVFDPHVKADLARIEDIFGRQDLSELIGNCVRLARKLVEDTAEIATVQIDSSQISSALSGEDEEEGRVGPLL